MLEPPSPRYFATRKGSRWFMKRCTEYLSERGYYVIPTTMSVISIVAVKRGEVPKFIHVNSLGRLLKEEHENLIAFLEEVPDVPLLVAVPPFSVDSIGKRIIIDPFDPPKFYEFSPKKRVYGVDTIYLREVKGYRFTVRKRRIL